MAKLQLFVHGGVAFEPYKKGFEKLLGKPIVYIENYLSSEGFIGYKTREHAKGMQLILNNNIFLNLSPLMIKTLTTMEKLQITRSKNDP
jgi:hypothetical protein